LPGIQTKRAQSPLQEQCPFDQFCKIPAGPGHKPNCPAGDRRVPLPDVMSTGSDALLLRFRKIHSSVSVIRANAGADKMVCHPGYAAFNRYSGNPASVAFSGWIRPSAAGCYFSGTAVSSFMQRRLNSSCSPLIRVPMIFSIRFTWAGYSFLISLLPSGVSST